MNALALSSQKVTPVSDVEIDDEHALGNEEEQDFEAVNEDTFITRYIPDYVVIAATEILEYCRYYLSYSYIKMTTRWLLESATCRIAITVF